MEKKIPDIFEYRDYRILLNDVFSARSSADSSYSLRAYARDISVSPSFLSDILRGKKDLSPQKGKELFSALGVSGEELDYVENLIVLRTSNDELLKRKAHDYIRQRSRYPVHANSESRLILKSLEHFFVYGVIERQLDSDKIFEAALLLGMSRERTQEVIAELVQGDCVVSKDGKYCITRPELVIPEKVQALEMQRQYVARTHDLMARSLESDQPEAMAEVMVLGLDESTQKLALEAQSQLFRTLSKLSKQSRNADRIMIYLGSMLTLSPKAPC